MNRTAFSICFASAMLFAPNAFATFISTPDDFLLDEDFTLTVPFSLVTTTDAVEFQEAGDGWDIFVGVQLATVNDITGTGRLGFFGEKSHELGGVVAANSNINSPIRDGVAGDTTSDWAEGVTEFTLPHAGGDDIYEYLLSITSVDRSVAGQLSMDVSLMFSGRHVSPPVVSVPEPSTFGLLGAGLVLVFVRRRRASKRLPDSERPVEYAGFLD